MPWHRETTEKYPKNSIRITLRQFLPKNASRVLDIPGLDLFYIHDTVCPEEKKNKKLTARTRNPPPPPFPRI